MSCSSLRLNPLAVLASIATPRRAARSVVRGPFIMEPNLRDSPARSKRNSERLPRAAFHIPDLINRHEEARKYTIRRERPGHSCSFLLVPLCGNRLSQRITRMDTDEATETRFQNPSFTSFPSVRSNSRSVTHLAGGSPPDRSSASHRGSIAALRNRLTAWLARILRSGSLAVRPSCNALISPASPSASRRPT